MQREKPTNSRKDDPDKQVRRIVRTREEIAAINSDDKDSLDKFVTHHGKILPQRITGVSAKQQRNIKKVVKQARNKNVL